MEEQGRVGVKRKEERKEREKEAEEPRYADRYSEVRRKVRERRGGKERERMEKVKGR